MIRTALALAVALCFGAAGAVGATTVTPFPDNPSAVLIVADGTAYLVVDNKPITSWVIGIQPGPQPNPLPIPSRVSSVLILEEQVDRTVAQAKVMDDPVWQTLALASKLTYEILDDDHPDAAKYLAAAGSDRPVVCFLDSDGKVVRVEPLPATVKAMRELIGGVK